MPTASGPGNDRAQPTPTLAATWQAMAGVPLRDELLEWPPDVFAFTAVILERTQLYRLLFPPPRLVEWPPRRRVRWSEAVEETGRQWSASAEDTHGWAPDLVAEEWGVIRARAETPLDDVAEGRDWRLCEAILTLHAVADEACAGLGVALDSTGGQGCVFRARGREVLARTGSLPGREAEILLKHKSVFRDPAVLCVLPHYSNPGRNGTLWRMLPRWLGPPVKI